jgi:hypothetical protein
MADFGSTGMDGLDGSFELETSETPEPDRDMELLVGFVDQGARPLIRVLLVKGHKFAFVDAEFLPPAGSMSFLTLRDWMHSLDEPIGGAIETRVRFPSPAPDLTSSYP